MAQNLAISIRKRNISTYKIKLNACEKHKNKVNSMPLK